MAKTYKANGKTLEEAIDKAHGQIPGTPGMADELITSKVVSLGRITGGIAGLREFSAEVERV